MTYPTVLELLRSSREWLSDPSHWTQRAIFRSGGSGMSGAENAASTCAYGALNVAAFHLAPRVYVEGRRRVTPSCPATKTSFSLLSDVAREWGYNNAFHLNDFGTYEEVLAMFDEAIRRLAPPDPPYAGLAEPSVPIQVPAPQHEPRETPVYPPSPSEPAEAPPVRTPAPAEPVPA